MTTADEMKLNSRRFKCPHCGAFAGHEWKPLHQVFPGNWQQGEHSMKIADGDPVLVNGIELSDDMIWQASQCVSCWKHSLWIEGKIAYPAAWTSTRVAAPHPEMPSDVAEIYLEAAAVLPHSRRAAVALSRAALERLVKELTPNMKSDTRLFGRLTALDSVVSSPTAKALHLIRVIGNETLHSDDGRGDNSAVTLYLDDSEDSGLVEMLFQAINDLVEQRISSPKKLNEFYDLLPDRYKDSIAKAAAAQREREQTVGG